MNLLVKLNLILISVFAAALIPAGMISRNLLNDNARSQVIQNARIMLETAMAMNAHAEPAFALDETETNRVVKLLADRIGPGPGHPR